MRLALHRSVTFWSGLLVVVFVCWAWSVSYDYRSYINYHGRVPANAEGHVSLGQTLLPGADDAGHSPTRRGQYRYEFLPPPFVVRGGGVFTSKFPPPWGEAFYREALRGAYSFCPPEAWGVFISHWLILLTVAAPWLGLLFWRARRRMNGLSLQQASPS